MSGILYLALILCIRSAIFNNPLPSYKTVENDDTLYIGTGQPLQTSDGTVEPIVVGIVLWEQKVNRAGITVNNKTYKVRVIIVDITDESYDPNKSGEENNAQIVQNVQKTWLEFCNPSGIYGRVDFMIAPFSSVFSIPALVISEEHQKITVAGLSSADEGFACLDDVGDLPLDCAARNISVGERRFNFSVGTRGLVSSLFSDFLTLMKIKQATTVGIFYENVSFGINCANTVKDKVRSLNMNITYSQVIPSLQSSDTNAALRYMKPEVEKISIINPDVVVGCGYTSSFEAFAIIAYDLKYAPKAFSHTKGGTNILIEKYGKKIEYFSASSGWDKRINELDYIENNETQCSQFIPTSNLSTCEQFYNEFINHSSNVNRVEPNDLAVSNIAALYVIHQTIVNSQSLNPVNMLPFLNEIDIPNSVWGPIRFNKKGENIGKLFMTLQMVNLQTIHRTMTTTNFGNDGNITLEIITPLFSSTIDVVYPLPNYNERYFVNRYLKTDAEIGIIVTTIVCLICNIFLMVLLIFLQDVPQIKAASFIFCELTLFGACLVYISIFFSVIYTNTVFCNLQIWLFLFGVDIFIGALLVKNIRLFYIFKHARNFEKKPPLENWQLLIMIFILMVFDAAVVIVWQAAFPIHAWRVPQNLIKPALDYIICSSALGFQQTAFLATLGSMKAILLIFCVVLSIAIRKQPSEFNESKDISFATYHQAFCLICLLATWQFVPDSSFTLKYILRSFIVLWGTAGSVIILFGRKFYEIGKNWAAGNIYKSHSSASSSGGSQNSK